MTKNITASYVKSINGTDKILSDQKPEVVFMGRSNVGKSSLINSLVGKTLARSSKKPGKTIMLDFFLVNGNRYFVDVPGYGFAKRSKDELEHFRKLLAWYLLESNAPISLVVLIIDATIGITSYDAESIELFETNHIPFVIVASKADKLNQSERAKLVKDASIILYSSKTDEGKEKLLPKVL